MDHTVVMHRISSLAFEIEDLDSSESDSDDQEERPAPPVFTSNERPPEHNPGRTMHDRFCIPTNTAPRCSSRIEVRKLV